MPDPITLCVRSGRHAGATLTLDQEPHTIGRGGTCDLVLSEPSIEETHFHVETSQQGVVITALDGPVIVPGHGEIEPGFRARLSGAVTLRVGDVTIELNASQLKPSRVPRRAVAAPAALVVAAAGAAMLVSVGAPVRAPAIPRTAAVPTAEAAPVQALAAVAETDEPASPAETPIDAVPSEIASEIAAALEQRGLDGVSLDYENQAFVLTGQVGTAELGAFRAVEQWFDESFPNLVLQADRVAIRAEDKEPAKPPAIQSAWHAERPYIVVGDRRYYVNDMLPGGWRLDGLDSGHVDFVLDGEAYRVSLAPEEEGDTNRLALR